MSPAEKYFLYCKPVFGKTLASLTPFALKIGQSLLFTPPPPPQAANNKVFNPGGWTEEPKFLKRGGVKEEEGKERFIFPRAGKKESYRHFILAKHILACMHFLWETIVLFQKIKVRTSIDRFCIGYGQLACACISQESFRKADFWPITHFPSFPHTSARKLLMNTSHERANCFFSRNYSGSKGSRNSCFNCLLPFPCEK